MSTRDPVIESVERCTGCGAETDGSWLVCAWCGEALSSPAELPVGAVLADRYTLKGILGRGGFGITYEAVDARLGRGVAIKELFPPSAVRHGSRVLVEPRDRQDFVAARIRFQREAAALARFSHAGIVRIYEVFEEHNTAYLVMELLHGQSLFQVLSDHGGTLSVDEVLDVALRVGGALSSIHDAGLLHRDVNPTNVMVDNVGRIVLIDFGLARRFGDDVSATFTRAVTPGYAPPEQYAGTARFGPACDVFGLAATTYKLLTGDTPLNVFDRHNGVALIAPHDLVPAVPRTVSDAVLDGMELNPDHRPASAAAFLDRLGLHDRKPGARALLAPPASSPNDATSSGADPSQTNVAGSAGLVGHGLDHDVAGSARLVDGAEIGGSVAQVWPPVPADASPWLAIPEASLAGTSATPIEPVSPSVFRPTETPAQVQAIRRGTDQVVSAPWHDGSPPVVGPAESGRAWVTVPLAAAAVALASSTPLVLVFAVAVVGLPLLATAGDLAVHRNRQLTWSELRRWHRAPPTSVAPILFIRNVAVGVFRAVPALAIGAVGVLVARSIGAAGTVNAWQDFAVRLTGVATMLCLVVPARNGGRTFRSGLGLDRVAAWAMEGRTKPRGRTVAVWAVLVFLVALGAWLHPELWPLSG